MCLTYLSFDVFGKGYCRSDQELESLLEQNVLLDYAAHHWGHHARCLPDEILGDMVPKFLQDDAKTACASQVLLAHSASQHPLWSQNCPKGFSGVHLCAFFGLHQIMCSLFGNGAEPDSRDSNGRTPLSWAAEQGHEKVVKLLLGREDVSVDSKDCLDRTPLLWAAKHGQEAVVKLLVDNANVDVDSEDRTGHTPLGWAVQLGYDEMVKLLLERDVEGDWMNGDGRMACFWATRCGKKEMKKLLIQGEDFEVSGERTHCW
jgi:hypothetical protein